jgi:uncharacterized protein
MDPGARHARPLLLLISDESTMTITILWLLVALLVLAGLAGVVLPALPGTPFIFLGLLLGAWIDHFAKVGGLTITLLGVLAAAAWLVDVAATSLGAKKVGASTIAIVGAALGTIAGLFFGIPGILFGPLLGAIIGELIATRDSRQAAKAGLATWIGLIVALAAKISLAFSMIGLFAAAYFVD